MKKEDFIVLLCNFIEQTEKKIDFIFQQLNWKKKVHFYFKK